MGRKGRALMAGEEIIKKVVGGAANKAAGETAKKAATDAAKRGAADTAKRAVRSAAERAVRPAEASPVETDAEPGQQPKPTAKETAKDIAGKTLSSAAQGAAQGAMVGGAAGAGVGALKGAAMGLASDKRARKAILIIVAIIAAIVIAIPVSNAVIATVLVSAIIDGKDENSNAAANESGVDNQSVQAAAAAADKVKLPWPLALAAQQQKKDINLQTVRSKLDELDPNGQYRDLTAGAEYQYAQRALALSNDFERKAVADKVLELTIAALVAAGLSEAEATKVFTQARSWALGEIQCTSTGTTGGTGVVDGDSFVFGDVTYNAKQVAIMKTVIGVAKSMYPTATKQAATVGLITTAVESRFQNYANDGIITDLDGSLSASQRADYEKLKFSLTLDHDAVGSDHASMGIIQQQATYGWGAITGSTWATDPEGVMKRIMNPAFAIARFYERMKDVDDWATVEPGDVAQSVQISAFPDAYAQEVPLADAIWAQYGADAPTVPIPAGINWGGSEGGGIDGDKDGNGKVVSACGEGDSGFGLATGDEKTLATQIIAATDRGEIIWWGDLTETLDQITRYANGEPIPPDCTDDPRVMQTILIAVDLFDTLSVNSLNRRCSGSTVGLGEASYHWSGMAVDLGALGGTYTTGGDANSIRMIKAFGEVANVDSGVGQLGCDGRPVLTTFREFEDSCNHLHLEVGKNDEPFKTKGTTP